ncbi:hypothetical protein [Halocatena pleomorpha]|uniref:hypothetical protein n=1 Tax=Halocatena pleomorpha TaxID=1785090 RepID=UPI00163A6E43|nr:hypothetical protein [Halocatena pleomorpha]
MRSGQQVWMEYAETFADEVQMDAYGNAVAVHLNSSRESRPLGREGMRHDTD